MLRPGFEPGSPAREAGILNLAILGGRLILLLPEPETLPKQIKKVMWKDNKIFLSLSKLISIRIALQVRHLSLKTVLEAVWKTLLRHRF